MLYLNFELGLSGIDVSSLESSNIPLRLTHYTHYPDLFDKISTPTISLNPLALYLYSLISIKYIIMLCHNEKMKILNPLFMIVWMCNL